MKKNLLIRAFAVVAMLLLGVSAVLAEQARMVIITKTGIEAQFPLDESPVITYQDNILVVETRRMEISVPAEDVKSFDFVSSNGSGVDEIKVEGSTLSGLLPGTPVDVYTIEGQHVASFKADESTTVTLELSDFAPGYYIVRTPNNSFKIKK